MSYKIPYDFVLNELYPLKTRIIKMLGGYGIHLDGRFLMLLRERETEIEFNGVFIATQTEHFKALQEEIHTSKMQFDIDGCKDCWIFISEDLQDFEAKVKKACTLIKSGDTRFGK